MENKVTAQPKTSPITARKFPQAEMGKGGPQAQQAACETSAKTGEGGVAPSSHLQTKAWHNRVHGEAYKVMVARSELFVPSKDDNLNSIIQ